MGPDIRRMRGRAKSGLETEPHAIRFVNTVAWRLRESPEERLGSAEALLEWLGANGIGDKLRHLGRPSQLFHGHIPVLLIPPMRTPFLLP